MRAQSDRLLGKMEEGGAHVQSFVSSSLGRLQTGAQGVGSSLGTTIQRCSLRLHLVLLSTLAWCFVWAPACDDREVCGL